MPVVFLSSFTAAFLIITLNKLPEKVYDQNVVFLIDSAHSTQEFNLFFHVFILHVVLVGGPDTSRIKYGLLFTPHLHEFLLLFHSTREQRLGNVLAPPQSPFHVYSLPGLLLL